MKKKFDVLTIVQVAMFMAITIVLGYINKIIPQMPQGGTISIDIIAIFLCGYFLGVRNGVICGIGVSVLQFILGQADYYGPWSVLLDYTLPLAVCGLAPLFKTYKIKGIDFSLGVLVSMVLKFICHYLSGAVLFAEYAPKGVNPYIYSLGYNFYYNFATLIVCMIIVPILYNRLKGVFNK